MKRLKTSWNAVAPCLMTVVGGFFCSWLTFANPAAAKDDASWPSAYGKLVLTHKDDTCTVTFKPTSGAAKEILSVGECSPDGLAGLASVEKAGTTRFPAKAPNGDEFHLFAIATARGGNACDGSDYYAVVVHEKDAWATKEVLGGCTELTDVKLETQDKKAALVARVKPSPDMEGAVYTVTFGKVETKKVPKVVRTVKTTKEVMIVGKLNSGGHFSNFMPFIELPKDRQFLIHQAGKCNLDAVADTVVELKASQVLYTDGSSEVTCLSVGKAKAKK